MIALQDSNLRGWQSHNYSFGVTFNIIYSKKKALLYTAFYLPYQLEVYTDFISSFKCMINKF